MKSKLKTGDVFQIRKNGRNYIALGKTTDNEGREFVCATLNGNINPDGTMRSRTGKGKAIIHAHAGTSVKRVHGHRSVDLVSVATVHPRVSRHLQQTDTRTGVLTDAANLIQQIREITASLE